MIKKSIRILKKYKLWFTIIILLNLIFGFLLWLVDGKSFQYLFPIMVLSSLLLYCTMTFIIYRNDMKREEAIEGFLEDPTIINENKIINLFHDDEGQIISNAIKYKDPKQTEPFISIFSQVEEKNIRLILRDNGIGVKAYDLPLIFEKGFTGEVGKQRKNSTGMGLYLAQQVAENLKISLEASMEYTDGFEISLVFPRVVN